MTWKTPEQVAREELGSDALAGIGYEQHLPYMIRAIEADRAARDLYALIAEALDERAEMADNETEKQRTLKAAAAVRGEGNYQDPIWNMFIGKMLDGIERVYGE
ncbi:MAG: hypothetical protein GX862_11110 [Leucobacter sp.]|jgi:hypothetical protein|nr:hypothetical protein [Leucobacter sp.]